MADPTNTLFLLLCFDPEGAEIERLVSAASRSKATGHAVKVNVASAADVARVLQAGGKIEEATA